MRAADDEDLLVGIGRRPAVQFAEGARLLVDLFDGVATYIVHNDSNNKSNNNTTSLDARRFGFRAARPSRRRRDIGATGRPWPL